jgi:hypothetical protein
LIKTLTDKNTSSSLNKAVVNWFLWVVIV